MCFTAKPYSTASSSLQHGEALCCRETFPAATKAFQQGEAQRGGEAAHAFWLVLCLLTPSIIVADDTRRSGKTQPIASRACQCVGILHMEWGRDHVSRPQPCRCFSPATSCVFSLPRPDSAKGRRKGVCEHTATGAFCNTLDSTSVFYAHAADKELLQCFIREMLFFL